MPKPSLQKNTKKVTKKAEYKRSTSVMNRVRKPEKSYEPLNKRCDQDPVALVEKQSKQYKEHSGFPDGLCDLQTITQPDSLGVCYMVAALNVVAKCKFLMDYAVNDEDRKYIQLVTKLRNTNKKCPVPPKKLREKYRLAVKNLGFEFRKNLGDNGGDTICAWAAVLNLWTYRPRIFYEGKGVFEPPDGTCMDILHLPPEKFFLPMKKEIRKILLDKFFGLDKSTYMPAKKYGIGPKVIVMFMSNPGRFHKLVGWLWKPLPIVENLTKFFNKTQWLFERDIYAGHQYSAIGGSITLESQKDNLDHALHEISFTYCKAQKTLILCNWGKCIVIKPHHKNKRKHDIRDLVKNYFFNYRVIRISLLFSPICNGFSKTLTPEIFQKYQKGRQKMATKWFYDTDMNDA